MKKEILVLDRDQTISDELGNLLAGEPYNIRVVNNLRACAAYLQTHSCSALILDLDTVDIDNCGIAQLKQHHPGLNIIAKSERTFHPELEESLRSAIVACLAKPLDRHDLSFMLKSFLSTSGHG